MIRAVTALPCVKIRGHTSSRCKQAQLPQASLGQFRGEVIGTAAVRGVGAVTSCKMHPSGVHGRARRTYGAEKGSRRRGKIKQLSGEFLLQLRSSPLPSARAKLAMLTC